MFLDSEITDGTVGYPRLTIPPRKTIALRVEITRWGVLECYNHKNACALQSASPRLADVKQKFSFDRTDGRKLKYKLGVV